MYVYAVHHQRHTGQKTAARTVVPVFVFYLRICCQTLALVGTIVICLLDRPGHDFADFVNEYLRTAIGICIAQVIFSIPLCCLGWNNDNQRVRNAVIWAYNMGEVLAEETPFPPTPDKPPSGTFDSFLEFHNASSLRARKQEGRKSILAPLMGFDNREEVFRILSEARDPLSRMSGEHCACVHIAVAFRVVLLLLPLPPVR